MKSAVVGGIGVVMNLAVMALLLKLTNIFNWRASAIASLAANLQNYLLQNAWTYLAGARKDFRKLEGYFSYLLRSAAGMVVATVSYAGLGWSFAHASGMVRLEAGAPVFWARLSFQFTAVVLGVWFNDLTNKIFARTEAVRPHVDSPVSLPAPTLTGLKESPVCKSVRDLAPEIGE